MTRAAVAILGILALAGCSFGAREDVQLRNLRSMGNGPDEFSILPGKPLQAPADFKALPTPTPGGVNLTDQNPRGDAYAVLGGRASATENTGISAADAALVRHAGRNGTPEDIRQTVAAEDREFRNRRGRFQKLRVFVQNKYNAVYSDQTLDSYSATETYRRAGVQTPSSPPDYSRRRWWRR